MVTSVKFKLVIKCVWEDESAAFDVVNELAMMRAFMEGTSWRVTGKAWLIRTRGSMRIELMGPTSAFEIIIIF